MKKLSPNLLVEDMRKTIDFYTKVLGFQVNMTVPDDKAPVWASLTNGGVEIMFQLKSSLEEEYPLFKDKKIGGTFTLFIETDNLDKLYSSCKSKAKIIKDLNKTFYGTTEFAIQDINGYVLTFSKKG